MGKRRKKKKFVFFYLIIFILIVGLLGKKFTKFDLGYRDTASAISLTDGLKIMGEKDSLNKEINKRIKEEQQRKLEIEKRKREEEQKEKEEAQRIANKKDSKKVAYLTFDDGPSAEATPIILNTLKKYNIKATFFVVGNMINENPDILKRVYAEGHQIGNHSYSHNYSHLYKSPKNFMDEIYKTEKLIKGIVGKDFDSKVIRFPGGSFEKKKDPMKRALIEAGYRYFDWNALNGDAEGSKFSESYLLNRLKETVRGKNKVVILMHDTDQKIMTAKSLEKSVKFLLDEGYEFQILDKNFKWE